MNNHDFVEQYLEGEPKARERKNKNRAIVNLLLMRFPSMKEHKESLIAIITEASTLDRWWRKILEQRPELRGSDYGHKDTLEHEKMQEFGYKV